MGKKYQAEACTTLKQKRLETSVAWLRQISYAWPDQSDFSREVPL